MSKIENIIVRLRNISNLADLTSEKQYLVDKLNEAIEELKQISDEK